MITIFDGHFYVMWFFLFAEREWERETPILLANHEIVKAFIFLAETWNEKKKFCQKSGQWQQF